MTEREYLIQLALNVYNGQYSMNRRVDEFSIMSIPTEDNYDRSYEIYTQAPYDFLRLRFHVTFNTQNSFSLVRIESDGTDGFNSLSDEVIVISGTMDSFLRDNGTYKFDLLTSDDGPFAILAENGEVIADDTGQPIWF